jgi:hypothetical protein
MKYNCSHTQSSVHRSAIVIFMISYCCSLPTPAQDSLMNALDHAIYYPNFSLQAEHELILPLYSTPRMGAVELTYKNENGNFRRPQQPASINALALAAGGVQRTGSLIVAGKFEYTLQRDEGQRWRNSQHQPDYQPFIWADSGAGTWNRSHFDAHVKIVSDKRQYGVKAGISMHYKGGIGDRDNTPKPLHRFHQLSVRPSLIYRGKRQTWSASIHYAQQSEDNEMGFYVNDSPLLYRLRGYGTFSRSPFVSGNRLLKATTLGGQIEYLKGKSTEDFLQAAISVDQTNGSIEEGIAIATPAGEWYTNVASGNFSWGTTRSRSQWVASLKLCASRTAARDPVFQAINYYLNKLSAQPSLRYARKNNWYVEINAAYKQREQRDIVSATNATVSQTGMGANGFYRFRLSDRVGLFAAPTVAYYKTIASTLNILTPSEISEVLVRPDFDILSRSYQQAGIEMGIDLRNSQTPFRFSTLWLHQRGGDLSRTQLNFSLHYFLL